MPDVFISYAHRDNEFPADWVSTLHERIEKAIDADYPHSGIQIHRDTTDFRKSVPFENQITRELEEAHVLLCVVSPSYVESDWCAVELEYFVNRQKLGSLIRVVKKPVKVTSQPESLQNLDGFNFFEDDLTMSAYAGRHIDAQFDRAVMPLAREIVTAVERARDLKQRVLLLSVRERANERDRLRNELKASGVEVVTEAHLPAHKGDWPEALRRLVAPTAEEAKTTRPVDFAVLLFGVDYWSP